MSRIFITGSSDGLGLLAGRRLADEGHEVMLHARSQPRAQETTEKVANAAGVLVGDLSRIADTRQLAEEANASGRFDAVIHNAGIGYREHAGMTCCPTRWSPAGSPPRWGGPGAPGDLESGIDTQCWLATSDEPAAQVSGRYFYHRAERSCHPAARDEALQDGLLERCAEISGVAIG